ncbi:MAG: general secretion pathway protein GspB [Desulfurivibrionaceae bacterium]
MSFILEALKKSEQQRQQKNAPQQEVRQRNIVIPARRSGWSPYWLAAGLLPLLLLFAWWLSGRMESTPEMSPATPAHPSSSAQSRQPEEAPVPRDFVAVPPPLSEDFPIEVSTATSIKKHGKATDPAPRESLKAAVPNTAAVSEQPEAHPGEKAPLYLDLPKELRDRMPRLIMSMHYHSPDPERRLVRINDRLLHEGDWLSGELQLVEITPTGATLNFLGKSFLLR